MFASVHFHGHQRKITQTDHIEIPISEGQKVFDVLGHVKTCYPDLYLVENDTMIIVNNQLSFLDHILKQNDKISFIPHIGGG